LDVHGDVIGKPSEIGFAGLAAENGFTPARARVYQVRDQLIFVAKRYSVIQITAIGLVVWYFN
jgi:hypothetical protein